MNVWHSMHSSLHPGHNMVGWGGRGWMYALILKASAHFFFGGEGKCMACMHSIWKPVHIIVVKGEGNTEVEVLC